MNVKTILNIGKDLIFNMTIDLYEYSFQSDSWVHKQTINAEESHAKNVIERNKNTQYNKFYKFICENIIIYTCNPFLFDIV